MTTMMNIHCCEPPVPVSITPRFLIGLVATTLINLLQLQIDYFQVFIDVGLFNCPFL